MCALGGRIGKGPLARAFVVAWAGLACGRVGYDELDDTADTSRADGAPHAADAFSPDDGSANDRGAVGSASTSGGVGGSGSGAGAGGAMSTATTGGNGGAGGDAGSGGTMDAGQEDAPPSCPSSITFGPRTRMPTRGDANAGFPADDDCPAGQAVIGYTIYPDIGNGLVGKLQTLCGTVSIMPSPTACDIVISNAATTLPLRGMQSDGPVNRRCPSDQVEVGARTRFGALIDQLSVGCARLTLVRAGSTFQVSIGAITWLTPVGGTGGTSAEDVCPAGQVATGNLIRSDTWINAFALDCSSPALVP
jgi:hypothetical protein